MSEKQDQSLKELLDKLMMLSAELERIEDRFGCMVISDEINGVRNEIRKMLADSYEEGYDDADGPRVVRD